MIHLLWTRYGHDCSCRHPSDLGLLKRLSRINPTLDGLLSTSDGKPLIMFLGLYKYYGIIYP